MTAKKIQPKNPDTTAKKTEETRDADRKTQSYRWGGRKSARKTSTYKIGH
jgi:hypothetical protein